jgi:plastocyanin
MASRKWYETIFGKSRRRGVSRPRRERDDWYIPLEVGRLEERRVLNVAPVISGANNLASIHQNQPLASNTGTQVASLISGKVTDPDPGALAGIAVTGANNTNGKWQYTTDGGMNWLDVGSPSNSSALLLAADANTYVRFLPNVDFNGTVSPGITFRAWDQTSGTAGHTADASTNGGTTAFSTATATSSVTVDEPITISGSTTKSINENQTTNPFSGVTISDSISASENISITLTQTAPVNGVLSTLGGFTNNNDGTYSFTGTAAAASTALAGMVFTPTHHQVAPGISIDTTFTILAANSVTSTTDSNSDVNVTAVNTAPTLSGANNFTPIQVNDTNSSGTLVSALIAGQASDPDLGETLGIAITASDETNGRWQYTLDGTNWLDVGNVANNNALLLTGDATTAVRFVPKAGFSGTVTSGITFRAWDGFRGTAGQTANTNSNGRSTAFSSATASSSIVVNDAPTLTGANNLPTINEDNVSSNGALVSELISGKATDADGDSLGIAITAADNSNGFWKYSTDNGANWTNIGSPTAGAALLLPGDLTTRVSFVPAAHFFGTSSITFQAWDETSGSALRTADATVNGGATAFSTASASSTIIVNAPPSISGTVAGQATTDAASINPFSTTVISDPHGPAQTLTVTVQIGTPANGQFTAASLTGWTTVTAGSTYSFTGTAAAATTAIQALVFQPTNHQVVPGNPVTTGFTVTANDQIAPAVTDNTTTVIATAINNPPTIVGTVASQAVNDNATIQPFSGVTISDPDNPAEPATITVTLDHPENGQFTAASTTDWTVSAGTYMFSGTRAQAQAALEALVFTPTNHQVVPGDKVTTVFTIQLTDGPNSATDSNTSVIATAINNPPTIVGTLANQPVFDNATIQPFGSVTISDPDNSAEPASITVALDNSANGQFTAASLTGWATVTAGSTYSFSGTRAQAQAALQALVFQPTNHQVLPGNRVTTNFTINLTDGTNSARDTNTSVVATAFNNPPTIVGTVANQAVNDNATISPFNGVTISDPDLSGEPATITVTLDNAANGQFTAASTTGWTVDVAAGTYSFSGTRAQAQAALKALVFVPTNHQVIPGNTVTTVFTISLNDGGNPASDNNTSVVATAINNPPTIVGTVANQAVNDNATIQPFSGVTISDPDNPAEPATITVTLELPENGQFTAASTTGWTVNVAAGTYMFSGTRAQAETALEALVFAPTNHQVIPGNTVTTGFTINLNDGGNLATDSKTSVVATAINNPPTIVGALANQAVNDNATISPFASVTISDPDNSAEPATITVALDHAANGQFSAASTVGWVVNTFAGTYTYTFSGTRAAAQAALQALVFVPTIHQVVVGSTVTTTFAIVDQDGPNNVTSDSNTTVVATAINDAPVLNPALVQPLTTITEKDTANAGNTVASILGSADTDVDFSPLQGIAITGTTITGFGLGKWQYSIDGGSTWSDIGAVSDTSALLLRAIDLVRFVPDAKNGDMGTLTYRAWDQTGITSGEQGTLIDAAIDGGTAPFSTATGTSAIVVQNVNDPPVLTPMTYFLPASAMRSVGAVNGTVVGGLPATDVDLPVVPFGWSIIGGNNGAFGINPTTGVVSVANASLYSYTTTPVVVAMAATESQFPGTPATGTQYLTIQPWMVTTSATQINNVQSTTLTINLVSGVNQSFTVGITWGDEKTPGQVSQTVTVMSNVPLEITHTYVANPDKANAAQPIPISITVAPTGEVGAVSATATTAAPVPGNVFGAIKLVDTTGSSFVETARVEIAPPPAQATAPLASVAQAIAGGAAASESVNPDERLIALRIVSPSDAESNQVVLSDPKSLTELLRPGLGTQTPSAFKLVDTDLNDLPALFKKLPDGRYQIYLSEEGHLRLVIDVVVRQGRAVDPTDDSGGRDRPPTGKIDVGRRDPIVEMKAEFQRAINSLKTDVPELQPIDTTLPDGQQWFVVPLGFASETAAIPPGKSLNAHQEPAAVRFARPVNDRVPARQTSIGSSEVQQNHWATPAATATAAVAIGAGAVLTREQQIDQAMAQLDPRSLSKGARLMRWLRKSR